MKPSARPLFLVSFAIGAMTATFAQQPAATAPGTPPPRTAAPALVTPEVQADRRITFRVAAPKATEVSLTGDWQTGAQKMEKGADGVWSITVGPLAPSSYIYSFSIDGVSVPDPVNPRIKLRTQGSGSIVEVLSGGANPAIDEMRDGPHGKIEINWHKAAALGGETRSVFVYTPPDYYTDPTRRYPVLYLLHGSNDRPNGWLDVGNFNALMDNLLAEKKVAPMIVVMPFGHQALGSAGGSRGGLPGFEDYLVKDVIPYIEAKYRAVPERNRRAIAGFSMGGAQSIQAFFRHLDTFASLAAISPAPAPNFGTQHAALLRDAGTNAKIDVLWLGCGRQDSLFSNAQQIEDALAANQIRHTWAPADGVHNYAFIRTSLVKFLPLFFQKQ